MKSDDRKLPQPMLDLCIAYASAPSERIDLGADRPQLERYLVRAMVVAHELDHHIEALDRALSTVTLPDVPVDDPKWQRLLDAGPETLADDDLGRILLDPTALAVLQLRVLEDLPTYFLGPLEEEGARLRRENGLSIRIPSASESSAQPFAATRGADANAGRASGDALAPDEWRRRTFGPSDFACSDGDPSRLVEGAATVGWRWEATKKHLRVEVGGWLTPTKGRVIKITFQSRDAAVTVQTTVPTSGEPVTLTLPSPPRRGDLLLVTLECDEGNLEKQITL